MPSRSQEIVQIVKASKVLERKIKFFKDPRILRTPTLSRKNKEKNAINVGTYGSMFDVEFSILILAVCYGIF